MTTEDGMREDWETVAKLVNGYWPAAGTDPRVPEVNAALSHLRSRMEELERVLDWRNKDSFVTENHHAALAQLRRVTEEMDALDNSNRLNAEALMEVEDRSDRLEQALRPVAGIRDRCCVLSADTGDPLAWCIHNIARAALSNSTEGTE